MIKYTAKEVAKMLGVSRYIVDDLIKKQTIGTVRIGKMRYITHDQYEAYLEAIRQPAHREESVEEEELDAAGEPWNARIHSAQRTKRGDGTWRKKRVYKDRTLVQNVNTELRMMSVDQLSRREEQLIEALGRALGR